MLSDGEFYGANALPIYKQEKMANSLIECLSPQQKYYSEKFSTIELRLLFF